jgi:hypothetical protein
LTFNLVSVIKKEATQHQFSTTSLLEYLQLASLVVFAVVADRCHNEDCDNSRSEYTITIGVISFLVGLGYLFIRYFAKIHPSDKVRTGAPRPSHAKWPQIDVSLTSTAR